MITKRYSILCALLYIATPAHGQLREKWLVNKLTNFETVLNSLSDFIQSHRMKPPKTKNEIRNEINDICRQAQIKPQYGNLNEYQYDKIQSLLEEWQDYNYDHIELEQLALLTQKLCPNTPLPTRALPAPPEWLQEEPELPAIPHWDITPPPLPPRDVEPSAPEHTWTLTNVLKAGLSKLGFKSKSTTPLTPSEIEDEGPSMVFYNEFSYGKTIDGKEKFYKIGFLPQEQGSALVYFGPQLHNINPEDIYIRVTYDELTEEPVSVRFIYLNKDNHTEEKLITQAPGVQRDANNAIISTGPLALFEIVNYQHAPKRLANVYKIYWNYLTQEQEPLPTTNTPSVSAPNVGEILQQAIEQQTSSEEQHVSLLDKKAELERLTKIVKNTHDTLNMINQSITEINDLLKEVLGKPNRQQDIAQLKSQLNFREKEKDKTIQSLKQLQDRRRILETEVESIERESEWSDQEEEPELSFQEIQTSYQQEAERARQKKEQEEQELRTKAAAEKLRKEKEAEELRKKEAAEKQRILDAQLKKSAAEKARVEQEEKKRRLEQEKNIAEATKKAQDAQKAKAEEELRKATQKLQEEIQPKANGPYKEIELSSTTSPLLSSSVETTTLTMNPSKSNEEIRTNKT